MDTPLCFGCGKAAQDDFILCGQYLCPECELEMIKTDMANPKYQEWLKLWREFWDKLPSESEENEDI